jgi:hypothetical protein
MAEYRINAELDAHDVAVKTMFGIGVVVLAAAVITPVAIVHGYIISVLWGWFLVPLWVPAINVAHAIGITALIGGAGIVKAADKIEGRVMAWAFEKIVVTPAILLGIGWVAKQFM